MKIKEEEECLGRKLQQRKSKERNSYKGTQDEN